MKNNIGKTILVLVLPAAATWARLWLSRSQPLYAIGSSLYDDRLFLTQAQSILEGNWLGAYNVLTLVKGPFFPLWAALMNALGLPLLLSGHVLYAFSCFVLTYALHPLIRKPHLSALLYLILLFNPAGFDAALTRASREMLYVSLTVLVAACAFGMLIASLNHRPTWRWGIGLGVSFGCFWLTREEGVWALPFLFLLLAGRLFLFEDREWSFRHFWSTLKHCLIPAAVTIILLNVVNAMNYSRYGVFAKTEMDLGSFKAAYGALTRVKPAKEIQYVPVTRQTRLRLYEVSPSFRELADYFEGPMGRSFWPEQANDHGRGPSNRTEILGGWFMWAFRDAVAKAGYYDRGEYPEEYYLRLADEINQACEAGKLDCLPERATLAPVLHPYHVKYLLPAMLERIRTLAGFTIISVGPVVSRGTPEELLFFHELTHEKILSPHIGSAAFAYSAEDRWNRAGISTLQAVLSAYRFLAPIAALLSSAALIVLMVEWIKKRTNTIQVLILASLLVLILTRIALLSLIDAASYKMSVLAYLHPLHPLYLSFAFLAITEVVGNRFQDLFSSQKTRS